MLSLGLKEDRRGIPYIDESEIISKKYINVDTRNIEADCKSEYYLFVPNDKYIIKTIPEISFGEDRSQYLDMVAALIKKQEIIQLTDFPIGYYRKNNILEGLIIRYYKAGKSLEELSERQDISMIKQYYNHSENNIRNLFLLLADLLKVLEELSKNGVYYIDVHNGNAIITDNKVKLIDFEPSHIVFKDNKCKALHTIIRNYIDLLSSLLNIYELRNDNISSLMENFDCDKEDIEGAFALTKKMEMVVNRR